MNLPVEDEHGQLHTMNESIIEELRQRGIVTERDGRLFIKEADIDRITTDLSWMAVCDFCSRRPVTFDIECDTFTIVTPIMPRNPITSDRGWYACEACGTLVERNARKELLERCIDYYWRERGIFPPSFKPVIRGYLEQMQDGFWKNYRSIKRITPRPFGH